MMTQRWRLVSGAELYDIQADPGQIRNVAAQQPDLVADLRARYDAWWSDVSQRFGEYSEIVLGSEAENPARLTCFDWHTKCPWNQPAIRSGSTANAFWAVRTAAPGRYRFALRRWPAEVDAPITAAVEGGKAIPADEARVKIGDVDLTKPIPPGAKAVCFEIDLPAAKTTLQTWLTDAATGQSRGAYYVYVTRLTD